MSEDHLPQCSRDCIRDNKNCDKTGCRMFIEYEQDNNCSLVAIYQSGPMTLDEVSKRLNISLVRVSQIEKEAMKKLSKRIKL
jgi:hypothetical protein